MSTRELERAGVFARVVAGALSGVFLRGASVVACSMWGCASLSGTGNVLWRFGRVNISGSG